MRMIQLKGLIHGLQWTCNELEKEAGLESSQVAKSVDVPEISSESAVDVALSSAEYVYAQN